VRLVGYLKRNLLIIEDNGAASPENLKNHERPTTVMTLCTLLV